MNVQPKFGAILVKELTFKQGHSQFPATVAKFQVTDEDKKTYKDLLDLRQGNTDEISINVCDVQSGGWDREFAVNGKSMNPEEYWAMKDKNDPYGNFVKEHVDRTLYMEVRQFLEAAPLGTQLKTYLTDALEKHSERTGTHGRKAPESKVRY